MLAWQAQVLAVHASDGCANGPIEAVNLLIRKVKHVANHIAHLRFVDTLRPGSSTLFAPDVPPLNDEERRLWRLWAESAHRHRSTPAYEVIISSAHLLIEDEMPECLLKFCAHKAGYDVLIERWKQGDYREHLSVVRHPGDELHDYLQQSFTRLKHEQARELAATQGRAGEKLAGRWPGLRAMWRPIAGARDRS